MRKKFFTIIFVIISSFILANKIEIGPSRLGPVLNVVTHMTHHGCVDQADFNRLYMVQILDNCSPSMLEKKEHCYIHKYNTLFPLGLNKTNPFGLPV